ncbi:MAG: DUF4870 domain-containing protein [Segetibacter sp.]
MIVVTGLFITVVGALFIGIIAIAALVLVIVATIKASEGILYRYPFSLRHSLSDDYLVIADYFISPSDNCLSFRFLQIIIKQ